MSVYNILSTRFELILMVSQPLFYSIIIFEKHSTSIFYYYKVYGHYAHKRNLISPDNHIAYVLDWVSIRVAG